MTLPIVGRALLATLLAPFVTACGALPAGDPLALDPSPPPTASPPDDPHPGRVVRYARKTPAEPQADAPRRVTAKKSKTPNSTGPAGETRTVTATRSDGVAVTVTVRVPDEQVSAAPPVAGARHLARLHPDVRRMARALHAEAAAAGVELKFISGHRAFDRHSKKAKKGRASWHAFGMAFDVNLAHRKDMRDALNHYTRDRAQWQAVGAIAERLGLTWGLQWGRHEVFHFEWHPGMPDAIRRPTLTVLLKDAGRDGGAIEKVWRRHWPTESAPTAPVAARDAD